MIQARLRTLQIIAGALIAGVVLFACVAAMLALQQTGAAPSTTPSTTTPASPSAPAPPAVVDVLRWVAIGLLVIGTLIAMLFIHYAAEQSAREFHGVENIIEESEREALFSRFFISRLIGLALVESAALLSVVNTILTAETSDLAVAALAVLIMLIVLFPTRARWDRFIRQVAEPGHGLIRQ